MKTALITATFLAFALGPVASVSAAPTHQVDVRQFYTCAGKTMSRVSLSSVPNPCCDGMLGCPQLLSNTGLVKPKLSGRT